MKKRNLKQKNMMPYFVLVVILMFISIICIEVFTLSYANINKPSTQVPKEIKQQVKRVIRFDTTKMEFIDMPLSKNQTSMASSCENGCNIRILKEEEEYKYLFTKTEGKYFLRIVKGDYEIAKEIDLGKQLSSSYFINYMGTIAFYNIFEDENVQYDVILTLNAEGKIDEFTSIGSREIILTEEGIEYYYDSCENTDVVNNALKVKAIRKPYDDKPKIITIENTNFPWCER